LRILKKQKDDLIVEIIVNGNFEESLKFFNKLISKDGVLKEFKIKSFFESNRQRQRRKHFAALRREKKRERG